MPRSLSTTDRYVSGALIESKYRLVAPLGEGGMGTVWLARNIILDAPVALKLIRAGMQDEDTVQRLLLEARIEAKLKHPNLARVFDFGETDFGDAYIVMEFLDGISLGDLIKQRGRLDPIEAVQLLLPVVAALCHAHENGVVHRDLKPQNIFLERVGLHTTPKLLDFGIAKLTDPLQPHFAEEGKLFGSPGYMAPEQATGSESVDHRADIWAVCVVLYEAISGREAFPGEGYAVLRAVIEDEVSPLSDTGVGEDELWLILARGLEKEPARRYSSMLELGTALAWWLSDRGEHEDLGGERISRGWSIGRPTTESDFGVAAHAGAAEPDRKPSYARPRRPVQMLDFARQPTLLGLPSNAPMQCRRSWAAAGWAATACAIVLAILLAPARTESKPRPALLAAAAALRVYDHGGRAAEAVAGPGDSRRD